MPFQPEYFIKDIAVPLQKIETTATDKPAVIHDMDIIRLFDKFPVMAD